MKNRSVNFYTAIYMIIVFFGLLFSIPYITGFLGNIGLNWFTSALLCGVIGWFAGTGAAKLGIYTHAKYGNNA